MALAEKDDPMTLPTQMVNTTRFRFLLRGKTTAMKKFLHWIILAAAVISAGVLLIIWFCVPRDQGACGETATYKIVGNTLIIEGTGRMYMFPPYLRDAHDRPWELQASQIRKVIISDGITEIGFNAFREMENLRSVEFADSVKTIGGSAFQGCISLSEVSANHVTFISQRAFAGCINLETADFPAIGEQQVSLYRYAYEGCTSLKKIHLGSFMVSFFDRCLSGCSSLEEISIDHDFNLLENGAFEGCTALMHFPLERHTDEVLMNPLRAQSEDPYQVLGDRAFQNCTSLVSITLPNWAWWVPSNMFRGCTGLQEVTLPEGLQSIEMAAFAGCTGIKRLEIPSTVTEIHPSAFLGWTEEQTIVVSNMDILPEELTDCEAQLVIR